MAKLNSKKTEKLGIYKEKSLVGSTPGQEPVGKIQQIVFVITDVSNANLVVNFTNPILVFNSDAPVHSVWRDAIQIHDKNAPNSTSAQN